MAPPPVGSPAPDFTLPSTSGSGVTLSALRGKNVLLAFFPAAFTSVCTAELCAISDEYSRFEQGDTVVLPISVDAIPSLKAYQASHQMKVDLLSDFRREVSRAYGVLNEERFASKRAYFLVDRDGLLRWAHVEARSGDRRENSEILAQIAGLS